MRKVCANGVHLHLEQHGDGTDVILVHGITSNLSYWLLTVLPTLMARHRVTVYDLRGHGFSDVTPAGYTTGEMARDLVALMDGLALHEIHAADPERRQQTLVALKRLARLALPADTRP